MKLSKQDFTIGAIDRVAVRGGIDQETVERLLVSRAGLKKSAARNLAAHWFSEGYRHGGIKFRRQEYLAQQKAA